MAIHEDLHSIEQSLVFLLCTLFFATVLRACEVLWTTQPLEPRGFDVVCSKDVRTKRWRVIETTGHAGNLLLSEICQHRTKQFLSQSTTTVTTTDSVLDAGKVVRCMRKDHASRFLGKEMDSWVKLPHGDTITAVHAYIHGDRAGEDELPRHIPLHGPICSGLHAWDVVCGTEKRRILYSSYPGNRRAFWIVENYRKAFANPSEKHAAVEDVMREIVPQSSGIRFLYRSGSEWVALPVNEIKMVMYEMLDRVSKGKLSPCDEAFACILEFLKALPLLGAKSVVVEMNVPEKVLSEFMAAAPAEAPLSEPGGVVAANVGVGTRSSRLRVFFRGCDYTWMKGPVKKMEDLMESGNYPHLECAIPPSLASQLLQILRYKLTGTTPIKTTYEPAKEMDGRFSRRIRSSRLFNWRKKPAKSIAIWKVKVEWY